jgi:hypothetical protein
MYCELRVKELTRPDLGWILGKHPERAFSKVHKKGRFIDGSWLDCEGSGWTSGYSVKVGGPRKLEVT